MLSRCMWFCLLCRTAATLYILKEIQDQEKRQVMIIQHHVIVNNIKAISLGEKISNKPVFMYLMLLNITWGVTLRLYITKSTTILYTH